MMLSEVPWCLHSAYASCNCFVQLLRATASDNNKLLLKTSVLWSPPEVSCKLIYLNQAAAAPGAPWIRLQLLQVCPVVGWSKLQLLRIQPKASCNCFRCYLNLMLIMVNTIWQLMISIWILRELLEEVARSMYRHYGYGQVVIDLYYIWEFEHTNKTTIFFKSYPVNYMQS